MEATRLAPAGRACSKFVWQSRFQKKLGGSSACHSGRPAFCDNHSSPPSITNQRSPGRWFVFDRFDLRYSSALGGAAIWTCVLEMRAGWRCDSPRPVLREDRGGCLRRGLATFLPRLGVTPRGRNAADGGTAVQRIGALVAPRREVPPFSRREVPRSAGGRRNSLANSKRSGINSAQRA
jgi:hypothetical protein